MAVHDQIEHSRPVWRDRLRLAIDRSRSKHSAIASVAGIAPETLSRILNAEQARPSFHTVVRIARALNVRVGWLLDEPIRGVELSEAERRTLRSAAEVIARFPTD